MTATYSEITAADIEILVAMMADFYAIDGYPIDVEASKQLFSQFIENAHLGKAWLIRYGNDIVGYMILTFVFSFEYKGTIAFVDELYLLENARGKGIGTTAIEFVKKEARGLKLKLLYLEVEHHNLNAQKLYLAARFEVHNRKLMQYKIN